MNRFLAALALLLLAAVPAAAQTNVVWGLATGANPRNLCVYDSTHACVTTGTLDSTLHVFTPSVPNGTITSGMLAAGVAAANLGFTPLNPANNLSDLTSATTARTNLGLGTAAVANTGTSGATLCLLNGACTFATMPTFTAGQLPPASGGTGLSTFTRSGNTTDFATATGTLTSGHCVSIDANGNFIDAGGACTTGGGGGTVTAGTVGQLAYYSGTTNTGSFALAGDCTFTYPNITCLKVNGTAFSTLATLTPGLGVATALAASLNASTGLVGYSGALGTPTSGTLTNATGLPISTGVSGLGANVATALAASLNATGGLVGYSGALGTPTSGTLTNATGLPISTGLTGAGTGVITALGNTLNVANGLVSYSGALGTPTSGTLTNATGLPISTGVSGLGASIPAALGTALNGTGALSATSNVTLITPNLGTPSTLVLTNATGLPISTGVSGLGSGVATALAASLNATGGLVGYSGALGTPTSGTLTNATGLPLATGVTGTLLAAQEPAHTGDVTNSAGSLALAITANAVSNAELAQMGAYTLKGNNTGSTANAADLTVAQVQAQLAITPGVANNAALTALASTYSAYVVRQGYAAAGDSPPLVFTSTGSACSLNAGAGDGGSQVPTSDGKCWVWNLKTQAVNVRWFGAKGDQSTDDRVPIQNAINALSGLAGEIYFPTGIYCVKSGSLTVSQQGMTFRGINRQYTTGLSTCGVDQSVISMSGYHDTIVDLMLIGSQTLNGNNSVVNLQAGCTECRIEDSLIMYGSSGVNAANAYEIYLIHDEIYYQYGLGPIYLSNTLGSWTGGYIQRVKMDQAFPYSTPNPGSLASTVPSWAASTVYPVGSVVVDGNYYIQATVGGTSGGSLPTLQQFNVNMTDNTVTWRLVGYKAQNGITADTGTGAALFIEDCDFSSVFNTGILTTNSASGFAPTLININNNTFGSVFGSPIALQSGNGFSINNNIIGGCLTSGCTAISMNSAFSGDTMIQGNSIYKNANGVYLGSGTHTTIIGNQVGGATTGVSVAAGVTDFTVIGNQLGGTTRGGSNTNSVYIATGASDYYTVTGNNTHGAAAVSDGGTGTHKTVSPNP